MLVFPRNWRRPIRPTSCCTVWAAPKRSGPILVGMGKPIHVLETGAEVVDIVNVAILAVVDAQFQEEGIRRGN